MAFESINPADGKTLKVFETWDEQRIDAALQQTADAAPQWSGTPLADRCVAMRKAAAVVRSNSEELARTVTLEMGKLIKESRAEVEKCAWVCEYYADSAAQFLADEPVASAPCWR